MFVVTALFSVFAYIWLLIVLKWVSPDEVEIWEAVLTFILFPILVKRFVNFERRRQNDRKLLTSDAKCFDVTQCDIIGRLSVT